MQNQTGSQMTFKQSPYLNPRYYEIKGKVTSEQDSLVDFKLVSSWAADTQIDKFAHTLLFFIRITTSGIQRVFTPCYQQFYERHI
jgi:hypothetical protein